MDETAFQTRKKNNTVGAVQELTNVWCADPSVNFHLSIVAYGRAAGYAVPPAYILLEKTVPWDISQGCGVTNAAVTTSPNEFINSYLFKNSHYSTDFIEAAARLDILLILLHPNATRLLQPLDVAVFGTLKVKLCNLIKELVEEDKDGCYSISKSIAIKLASDEESILFDEDGHDQEKSNSEEVYDSEADDADINNDDEIPLDLNLTEAELDRLQAEEWDVFLDCDSHQVQLDPMPLYDGSSGPTRSALAYATNPLAIFYFFLPKELWRKIAEETNTYPLACVDEIAQAMSTRASQRREAVPSTLVYTVEEYKTKLKRKNPIQPHEIIRFIGRLIVRTLEPRRKSLSRHWITKVEGALSRGTFGQFLSRERFQDIDMPMKPNKWGTKFYMTCCADTAHCARLDIYCGKANKDEEAVAQRAVLKNLTRVLRGQPTRRLICTDNFYTSVPLSHKLLSMDHAHVGIIRKNRKGWCLGIEFKQKKRPKHMPRGAYRLALWRGHPEYVALTWMDNKPVRFLATGCSTQLTHVSRRERDGSISQVACPRLVRDYHEAIGGVDLHDQLRLQRYSIQRSIRMRKYYKAFFLGLVDIAMINAFIVHKIAMKKKNQAMPTHAAFLRRLHVDMLNQTSEDFNASDDMARLVTETLPSITRWSEQRS
ncbi:hypothetical protein PPTG_21279 [Phytophthora nicotianae INRA-310]|uniref:PiggyBac transposable element-derived protein domain-containing protein n=1 Tax=Phytophthora nicotianae (strain INRA-310) TaxID=761204 RepID=W2R4N2_PHYN3|nr:hypothetical protein PPTG_21279 [Phytophthora nicotianae INRA-310]ETN20357.1 hypothetical protein PPTG_21279 [Phytophthora nicotianae INRA-310]